MSALWSSTLSTDTISTDTIIARDAFRGMLETLSNSEKDIRRATRLAFNCAKNGMENEVIEIITQKMENEPSLSRRLELFFVVDSISQLSKRKKDNAGAYFIPIIEAQRPRLLLAAAPHWVGARENHIQSVKVLRLWIERKIFPECDLQPYVNDMELFMKNSYPADGDTDGQARDIDSMLVEESGSNVHLKYWPPLPPNSPPQDPPVPSSPPPPQEYKTIYPRVSIPPPSVPGPSNHFTFLNTSAEKQALEYPPRVLEPLANSMLYRTPSISGPLPPLEMQMDNNVSFQPICVRQRPFAHSDGFQTVLSTTVASRPPTRARSPGQPMMWYGQLPTAHGYSKACLINDVTMCTYDYAQRIAISKYVAILEGTQPFLVNLTIKSQKRRDQRSLTMHDRTLDFVTQCIQTVASDIT